ncbi:MAG: hypothetical protein H7X84_10235 [Verrucomicrobia bacterium]|nr:hypothetical protein [Prolixibacteraceae bacterium]
MKPLLILLIVSLSLLTACSEQMIIPQNSCPNYKELYYLDSDSLKTDPVNVSAVNIEGDCLRLTLQYSGGCKEHEVNLVLVIPECGTPPLPPPAFRISHDANGDMCEAWLTKVYSFDISGLREEGKSKTDFVLTARNAAGEMISTTYTYNY